MDRRGKACLIARGEAVKGFALAVLLALFALAGLVLEKLAHQGDDCLSLRKHRIPDDTVRTPEVVPHPGP